MKAFLLALILLFNCTSDCFGARLHPEKDYRDVWCKANYGESEVTLADRTRVDCLTFDYAVEVDFSNKWAEAIGQSLHYARMTDRKPGIVLIVETDKDLKHYYLLEDAIKYICPRIKLWKMIPGTI